MISSMSLTLDYYGRRPANTISWALESPTRDAYHWLDVGMRNCVELMEL
jgi:hypothetical protein